MGGKKNQTQRTKNSARPSSSGRSADLLGTTKPLNPFLAFSFQKDSVDDGFQEDIDPSFQVILKKMSKKDSTTKLKALQEFTNLCLKEEIETEKIVAVLSFWSRQYIQLAIDIEHKVRESAHVCHEAVVRRCKRNLAPFLRQLAGPWFISQCDTHAPAASAASRAFSNAFPPNKIQEAILFCQSEIIKYIVDNLTIQTAESVSSPNTTTPEEREMKYQRILISCLQGYALYLERIPTDQLIEVPNKELVTSKSFWKHARNGAPVVRSAWYSSLIALCQYAKHLLEDQLPNVAKMTVGCLDETDALVAPLVWEASLHALVALPDIWSVISIDKVFTPKLYSVCRKAGHGSASVTFPSLLPLISKIPAEKLSDPSGFYDGLFSSLRQGLEQRSVQQSLSEYRVVVDTLVECIQYCVASKQESDPELCRTLVRTHLLPLLTSVENANPKIVVLLKAWSQKESSPLLKELFHDTCEHITNTFTKAVEERSCESEITSDETTPEINFRTIIQKQIFTITNLLKGDKLVSQHLNKKVNFASGDRAEEIATVAESVNTSIDLYDSAICDVAGTVCASYLRMGCDTLNPFFINGILKIVKVSNASEIFNKLASVYGFSESFEIFTSYFLQWMHTPEIPLFCKDTVSLSMQLLFYLPSEIQQNLLDQVLEPSEGEALDPKLLLWMLEDLTSPEAKQNFRVEWIRNSALRSKLIKIAEEVVSSLEDSEESIWTLLERVAELSVSEGHGDDGYVLNGILRVFEDNLQSENIEMRPWLVSATRVLEHLYDSRGLSVLALPPDHSVVQSIFQVYLEGIEDNEQLELFNLCSKAVLAIFQFSGPDSPLFKNIWTSLNEHLQNYVLSLDASQIGNIVTVATRLASLLRPIDGEDILLSLFRKLCGPPSVPGSTGGPLAGVLSEQWCIANALIVNADSIVCGGTYRSEADVLADRYSPCLAEGIPIFGVSGFQMELTKPVLWTLLSAASLADVGIGGGDSMSPALCSLISDLCAALAVTSDLSKHFPSMGLTYCVDSIKIQSDQHWKRVYSDLSLDKQEQVKKSLFERAADDLKSGGRYWLRALEFWVNFSNGSLSKKEADVLVTAPAEYYSTVLISRLGLIKKVDLPVPVIPSSGTLDTLNLGQLVELVMYLLSSEENQEKVALQGLSALSCVHRLDSKRLLFDCNIFQRKTSQVRDVTRSLLFVRTVLLRCPAVLTEPHWDLILISVASWIPSLQRVVQHILSTDGDLPHVEGLTPTMVCSFVANVCDLYATLQSVLSDVNDGSLKLPENIQKESITEAWRDVFASECDGRLVRLWMNLADSVNQAEEISPMASLALEHISACVSSVSLNYLNENLSPEVEEVMEQLLSSLSSPVPAVRLASYHLLIKLVPIITKKDAQVLATFEDEGRKKSSEGVQLEELVISVFGTHVESLQNEIEEIFEGTRLGETVTLEPFTEQYNQACGYLLLWLIVLEMHGAANADVRFEYASFLKSQNLVQKVLYNVFRLLPQIVLRKVDPKNKITHDYFTKKPSLECAEKWTFERLSRIACQVFLGVLIRLPASLRTWWGEVDSKSSAIILNVVSEHCSSIVSAVEMKDVLRHQEKAVENMTVKVLMSTREVIATYSVDDLTMELIVKLPSNYPLAPMTVEIGKRYAAAANQWKTALMQITIFLQHQNGSLWDGLTLWRNNVVRRYEGVEECFICYCVVHVVTYQLPKVSCRTCRKKFHSPCLFKWFQSSNKSTCPLCRNLF